MSSLVENTTVIIPAAGPVPESILALSNIGCPAMIPVAGRPVIYWTMSYLRSLGLKKFVIAVAQRGLFIEDFVDCTFGRDTEVQFIVPSRDGGLGQTVCDLLENVKTPAALAVLGDTHFKFAEPDVLESDEPFVLVHPVEESYRWCIAESDENGTVHALRDKEQGLEAPLEALIGVYSFPDAAAARETARQAVKATGSSTGRTEMAAILRGLDAPLRAVRAGDWLDCGNPDRQASSHRSLLQQRAFNELSIDPVLGTITKRSRHVQKFINEINYLRLLPPELAVLFPRIVEHSTSWGDPHITMEYYGYPTLSEMFVFENVEPGIWEQVFEHLHQIVTDVLMRHRQPLNEAALRLMYVQKTRERLEADKLSPELQSIMDEEGVLSVNGSKLRSLSSLWPGIESAVSRLSRSADAAIIHGDLCFSNILYDLGSRVCKLIDPRGSFAQVGLYGDPRYDVAKLYHSVYGLYDFIVNDLFEVTCVGTSIDLQLRTRPQHDEVLRRFDGVFFPDFDRDEILLITGLLFVSMPALHYDYPRRQVAMYTRGLQLLNEVFESSNGPRDQSQAAVV